MLDLTPIKQEVDDFLYNHQEVVITTQDDYTNAGDVLKQIQLRLKKLEDKRKEYTAPLDESKKRIMTDFKKISEPLEQFVELVKSKMLVFYQAEQKRLDEEQKKLEAKALAQAKAENKIEVVVPVVNNIQTQRGSVATSTVKKIWTYDVIDETQVPREFLCVDETKIREAVRNGVREIAGVKIYQKDSLSLR